MLIKGQQNLASVILISKLGDRLLMGNLVKNKSTNP